MSRISRRTVMHGIGLGLAAAAATTTGALYRRSATLVPGHSRAMPVNGDATIPAQADAVVIGGGDTGVVAALCLAERGLKVALCEKGVIGGEASGRSLGSVDSLFLSPAKAELVLRAKALWPRLNARVGGDTGYARSGMTMVLQSEEMETAAREWVKSIADRPDMDPKVVDCGQLMNLGSAARCRAVLYQASDGQAEPRLVAPAIALGARSRGATLHQQCAVRAIERSGGAVSGVITEHGPIRTKIVIVAGGVWTPLFCGNLGLGLPQLSAFASGQTIAPLAHGPTIQGVCDRALWRPQADGGYTLGYFAGVAPIGLESFRYGLNFLPALRKMDEVQIAWGAETLRSFTVAHHWREDERTPFEDVRIFEPAADLPNLAASLKDCRAIHPAFANARVLERYAGALTTTPDNMPVISTVGQMPGLLLGTGLYFGLTVCPAAGELLADLATGATPKIDPRPFRYERLVDGSPLTFQA